MNPITDGLIIAGRPPFAMDDNVGQGVGDDFLQVMEKKLRGRNKNKVKRRGFGVGAAAAGAGAAAGVSHPLFQAHPPSSGILRTHFLE